MKKKVNKYESRDDRSIAHITLYCYRKIWCIDSGLIQNIQNQLVIKYQLDLTDTAQRLLIFIREW